LDKFRHLNGGASHILEKAEGRRSGSKEEGAKAPRSIGVKQTKARQPARKKKRTKKK